MKAERLLHSDALTAVAFDNETWVYWDDDSPLMIAFPNETPVPYESGVREIDALLSHPTALYSLPSEALTVEQEQRVREILGC
ncbi:hypothetical protein [Roseiconus lacunae]|uniref:Uncharacterized protein n=1 Tax=Roseiconus lacunae TaxID=2605694 RepID=A0ABT7PF07_9BACT|nr:hypothetical protein [Roseiconus lacunae]MDM4014884.1 hypothetical protein [Roseiconus lacunae]